MRNLTKWMELYNTKSAVVDPIELAENIYAGYYGNKKPVYPEKEKVFSALDLVAPEDVKVVIVGQDPYHTPGQAQGLAFSLPDTAKTQPSMWNILKELYDDTGIERTSQDLTNWTTQGVLLLNRSLTVEEGEPNSMADLWTPVTNRLIEVISELPQPIIFVLWGKSAQQLIPIIKGRKEIIATPHPSPFSAHRGFFGSKPFSRVNEYLDENNQQMIDWSN
jgi:uracil-DNA glycosylase